MSLLVDKFKQKTFIFPPKNKTEQMSTISKGCAQLTSQSSSLDFLQNQAKSSHCKYRQFAYMIISKHQTQVHKQCIMYIPEVLKIYVLTKMSMRLS